MLILNPILNKYYCNIVHQSISEIYGLKLPGYAWRFHIQSSNQITCRMYLLG